MNGPHYNPRRCFGLCGDTPFEVARRAEPHSLSDLYIVPPELHDEIGQLAEKQGCSVGEMLLQLEAMMPLQAVFR